MGSNEWKSARPKLSEVLLDALNPRLSFGGAEITQAQIIEALVRHDNVEALAKQIADQGYLPTEILAAIEDDHGLVVVEGNRRLTALKLLANPSLAPESSRRPFEKLSARMREPIDRVPLMIAPSRDAVIPLMIARHTQQGVERWSPPMQAHFVRSLLKTGHTPEELQSEYGLSIKGLEDAIFNADLHDIALSITLPEIASEQVRGRDFPWSTLERVMRSKPGKQFFGIEVDGEHGLRGKIAKEEFVKGYAHLVSELAQGSLDSRKLNKESDIAAQLGKFPKAATPLLKRSSTFGASDITAEKSTQRRSRSAKAPISRVLRTPKTIVPPTLRCTVGDPRIREVFRELRELRVREHPNATAVLLRVLLDLAASRFLDIRGEIKEMISEMKEEQGSNPPKDWHPGLQAILWRIMESDLVDLSAQQRRAIKTLISARDTPLTLDSLHAFVHNRFEIPTERELRGIMIKLEPLLDQLLNDKDT